MLKLVFFMMKKLIVKNIMNYLKIADNSPVTDNCMGKMEMQAEAYIILDKCISNFDIKASSDFYYYYNKSLARNFYRMFDREYRRNNKHSDYSTHAKIVKQSSTNHDNNYDVDFIISQLGLSEIEKRVVNSKLIRETKDNFLSNNPDINSTKYHNALKVVKKILINMKEDGAI